MPDVIARTAADFLQDVGDAKAIIGALAGVIVALALALATVAGAAWRREVARGKEDARAAREHAAALVAIIDQKERRCAEHTDEHRKAAGEANRVVAALAGEAFANANAVLRIAQDVGSRR